MNYYDELEVTNNASTAVIKAAYKAQVKHYHPDVFKGDKLFATNKIKKLNEAHEVLSNPLKRLEYDNLNNIKTVFNNTSTNETKYQSHTKPTSKQDTQNDQEEDLDDPEDDSDEYYYEKIEYSDYDDDEFNRKILLPILVIFSLLFISFIISLILNSQLAS